MREIKFRAWDSLNQMMVQDFIVIEPDGEGNLWIRMDRGSPAKYDNVMQYTGLKDKRGQEIYEGDLIANETGRICKVVWFQPSGQWDAFPVGNTINTTSMGFATTYWQTFVEVIGNIYENGELL